MKLIIESGATKTEFCLAGEKGAVRFKTSGLNLATMEISTVSCVLRDAVSRLKALDCGFRPDCVTEVHFYGAGLLDSSGSVSCRGGAGQTEAEFGRMLHDVFPSAGIECCSDLMAASRALWGKEAGITAILGTGSNSCLYDGDAIVENIRPCGYVLGDFGGASALGKAFFADYLQGLMPGRLADDFRGRYGVDYSSAVEAVYKGDAPARYLASFAPYIVSVASGQVSGTSVAGDRCDVPCGIGMPLGSECREYAERLVMENFRTFMRRCIVRYDCGKYDVGVTGSFGCACREFVRKVAEEERVRVVRFLASPMDGLVRYHDGVEEDPVVKK